MLDIRRPLALLRADVLLSRDRMKEMLGYCTRHLCWPEGWYSPDYIRIAQELELYFADGVQTVPLSKCL
ncbi:TPA: polysaccharide deacetylase family protein [Escherichia coli]|nr:polysaccharide deacetylase family protein [Escherichia coli]